MLARTRLPGRPRRAARLAALALTALTLSACGASARAATSGSGAPREVRFTGLDTMRFDPGSVAVAPGETVTVTFRNDGVILHDLVTTGATENVRLERVPGGTQQRATFRATRPGAYAVICTQPGHREAGMVGQIVVRGRASG
jgi:plastocyanin